MVVRECFLQEAVTTDEREAKLPAWVREKLAIMRRAAIEATAELRALKEGTEPGPFWIEGWEGKDRWYLPRAAGRLVFGDPNKSDPDLELTTNRALGPSGYLNINARTSIAARPWASNVLLIKNVETDD